MYDESQLSRYAPVDYVITPVVAQQLPFYTLVDGGPKALRLAQILKPKAIIPMANGELEQSGLLASIVKTAGTSEGFRSMALNKFNVLSVKPGVPVLL